MSGPIFGRGKGVQQGEARAHARYAVRDCRCDLGEICDLSIMGMRIRSDGKPPIRPDQILTFELTNGEGSLSLTGRIAWVSRRTRRAWDVGVQFLNLSKHKTAALHTLAVSGVLRPPTSNHTPPASDPSEGGAGRPMRAAAGLPDYYGDLGLTHSASADDIRAAHRRLVRAHHPDVNPSEDSRLMFQRVQQAYEVLRDDEARRSYDRRLGVVA
ncbi:MAG: DnaJ domain-containing protein [Planctomycetota bacterium]|nr:DnaJ domain-containing protein [Planctomycetota bacterium]